MAFTQKILDTANTKFKNVKKECTQIPNLECKNYNNKKQDIEKIVHSIRMVSRQVPALSYPPPSVTHAVPLYTSKTTKHTDA